MTEPVAHPETNKQPASKPWYKNWKILAAIVVVIILLSQCGGDDDGDAGAGPDSTETIAEQTAPTEDAAEEPAETETEEATPEATEEETEEPAAVDEAEVFTQRILDSGAYSSWSDIVIAQADLSGDFITLDQVSGHTVFLKVQAALTEDEKVELGHWMFNMSGQQDYRTFVVTDTTGIDQNVFCSPDSKVCATSIWDT